MMTLLHTTRYFNCGFQYYKYNSVELIFEESKLNEISENKFPSKTTRYMVHAIINIYKYNFEIFNSIPLRVNKVFILDAVR